jgi:hypothetical protein
VSVCWFCKEIKEIVHTDEVDRGFCENCVAFLPTPAAVRAMDFLIRTIPFRVGDRVEAWLVGEVFDGTGPIDDISIEIEHGGTPVRPAFHVVLQDKARENAPEAGWYTEGCLVRAE